MSEAAYLELRKRLGPSGVSRDPDALRPMLQEWRGRMEGTAPFAVFPATVGEVRDVIEVAGGAGLSLTPQGGNTGLVLGQIPQGEILVSLKRMNRIRRVDLASATMVAEAGLTLGAAHAAADEAGRQIPLHLASEGSATIGGLVSTNAGGVHVLRYGMMRSLVTGLEVVLANGDVLDDLDAPPKNNTGYDLKQLFIGAEGTLGIVTAAALRLYPKAPGHFTAMAAGPSIAALLDLLGRLQAAWGPALVAFEVMNAQSVAFARDLMQTRAPFAEDYAWLALTEAEADPEQAGAFAEPLAAALEAGEIADAVVANSEGDRQDFWRLREALPAAHKLWRAPQASHDTATPVSRIPDFIELATRAVEARSPGAKIVAFGHAGDGNIHFTPLAASPDAPFPKDEITADILRIAADLGGSISAEHGIGTVRKTALAQTKSPAALSSMRAIKAALDPGNLFNPRVLLP